MTTYYFIRHAEKQLHGYRNPHLSETGKQQAKSWAKILSDKSIDMIFCTSLKRTHETAQPLAQKLDLPIIQYDMTDLYNRDFKQQTLGKTVLVVGHQDTTPAFVNRILRKNRFSHISAGNHSNLYRVTIDDNNHIESHLAQVSL